MMENVDVEFLKQILFIKIIKGKDAKQRPYTAYLLLTQEQKNDIEQKKKTSLNEYEIFYKKLGHDISPALHSEIMFCFALKYLDRPLRYIVNNIVVDKGTEFTKEDFIEKEPLLIQNFEAKYLRIKPSKIFDKFSHKGSSALNKLNVKDFNMQSTYHNALDTNFNLQLNVEEIVSILKTLGYDENKIISAVSYEEYLNTEIYTKDTLNVALQKVFSSTDTKDLLIVFKISSIHKNFVNSAGENNHWVALHFGENNNQLQNSLQISYIDPTGAPINQSISHIIGNIFHDNTIINTTLALQYTSPETFNNGVSAMGGNDYDCGPLLALAAIMVKKGIIHSKKVCEKESKELGQKLRVLMREPIEADKQVLENMIEMLLIQSIPQKLEYLYTEWLSGQALPLTFPTELRQLMEDHRNVSMTNTAPDFQNLCDNNRLLAFKNTDIIGLYLDWRSQNLSDIHATSPLIFGDYSQSQSPNNQNLTQTTLTTDMGDANQSKNVNDQEQQKSRLNSKKKPREVSKKKPREVFMPIKYYPEGDENQGKISSVKFSGDLGMAPSLVGAADWTPNPRLSIITGVNGSGKSQLLRFLAKEASKRNKSMTNTGHYLKRNIPTFLNMEATDSLDSLMFNDWVAEAIQLKKLSEEEKKNHIESFIEFLHDGFKPSILNSIQEPLLKKIMPILMEKHKCMMNDRRYAIYLEKYKNALEGCRRNNRNPKTQMISQHDDMVNQYFSISYECLEQEFKINPLADLSNLYMMEQDNERKQSILGNFNNDLEKARSSIRLQESDGEICFISNNQKVDPKNLSSGEKLIVYIIARKIIVEFSQERYNKVHLMLLDEPDKHLDPKLSKVFMDVIREVFIESGTQVIMTTHRTDTIALSPRDSVFTINRNPQGITQIVPTHPLLAMFRLTTNLRAFTNHHHVVYTESRNDALFYEGVYKTLVAESSRLRQDKKTATWQAKSAVMDDLLSRRLTFSFMCVTPQKDGNGGCLKVIEYISSDITAFHNINKVALDYNGIISSIDLVASYGILDNDYDKKYNFENIGKAEGLIDQEAQIALGKQRAIVGKRHSLENYICDPFVLCSISLDTVLSKLEDNSKKRFKIAEELKTILSQITREAENLINTELQTSNTLQIAVNSYFNLFFRVLQNQFENRETSKQENKNSNDGSLKTEKEITAIKNVKDRIETESIAEWGYAIDGNSQTICVNGYDKHIVVYYPEEIINLKGHDIATALFGSRKGAAEITYLIAESVNHERLKYIPIDLVEIFFELNKNVREHVRKVIKPHTEKMKWSEKIRELKSNNIPSTAADYSVTNINSNNNEPTPATSSTNNTDIDSKEENNNSNVNSDPNTNNNRNIRFLNEISYTNPNLILRQDEMLHQAGQIAGMDGINRLINLGEDPEIARGIVLSAKEYGITQVLNILFSDIKPNVLSESVIPTQRSGIDLDVSTINVFSEKLETNHSWVERCRKEESMRGNCIELL